MSSSAKAALVSPHTGTRNPDSEGAASSADLVSQRDASGTPDSEAAASEAPTELGSPPIDAPATWRAVEGL